MTESLLTEPEKTAITRAGELAALLANIIGYGHTRDHDVNEVVGHIHAIQHAVMAQAAARAYPDDYRLLGETL